MAPSFALDHRAAPTNEKAVGHIDLVDSRFDACAPGIVRSNQPTMVRPTDDNAYKSELRRNKWCAPPLGIAAPRRRDGSREWATVTVPERKQQ